MKIRQGHVSNSSSTSFCLFGIDIDIQEAIGHFLSNEEVISKPWEVIEKAEALVRKETKEMDLEVLFNAEGDDVYAGIPPMKMRDEETLSEFKERVVKEIKEIFPDAPTNNVRWMIGEIQS